VDAACASLGGERVPEAAAFWNGLREQTLPFYALEAGQCLWRLSMADSAGVLDFPEVIGPPLIEWGGALRWIKASADACGSLRVAMDVLGGTATLFRCAPDLAPRPSDVFHPLVSVQQRIHQELKKQFDPAGIFNRGRMYADL
ncbi:MAG: glycolate oxidase subunit GlcE, partial [Burkholderiaceae bacterium]